jgi:hypothetical protein
MGSFGKNPLTRPFPPPCKFDGGLFFKKHLIGVCLDHISIQDRTQARVDQFDERGWTRKRVEFDPVDLLARENLNPEEVAQLFKSVG